MSFSIDTMNELLDYEFPIVAKNKKISYYNIPCAFDIETSSFYDNGQKSACMYIWQLGINHNVIYGRTWLEFIQAINILVERLELNPSLRLIIYVHNLSYEFQFIKDYFTWIPEMLALEKRKPIKAITDNGIEFRCSYQLSGYSLEKLGTQLKKYKIEKMVGDLDYNLMRHSNTPLTDKELGYCINDVRVVMCYIQECIDDEGNISAIPSTKTGYVRRYCRNNTVHSKDKNVKYSYRKLMRSLTLRDCDEYKMLISAFQGGFTHANTHYIDTVQYNVRSYDFTSSYPTVMVAEEYPMSTGEYIDVTDKQTLVNSLKYYCCVFSIELHNVTPLITTDFYLSVSRCVKVVNPVIANGRIVSADTIITTITNIDFDIIRKFYKWEHMTIGKFIRYRKSYLPTPFVESVLSLYKDKTELKDIEERKADYDVSKAMLNATYGMTVTNIIRDEISYCDKWVSNTPDMQESIDKYNNDSSRFLFYPWGVFITAYARMNLFSGILNAGTDYIYADTDSIKILNYKKHTDYIKRYNKYIINKLERACEFHKLSYELIKPKTIEGKEKPLGVWDDEGSYTRFKTLGAKRYMVEKKGDVNITVSGLNKKVTVPYILSMSNDPFEFFTDGMNIPKEYTGKLTHTYIDNEQSGILVDYKGEPARYNERSCVHLEGASYKMELSDIFKTTIDMIRGVKHD